MLYKAKALEDAGRIVDKVGEKEIAEKVTQIFEHLFRSLPGTRDVWNDRDADIPDIRDHYLSVSAAALYAVCTALHQLTHAGGAGVIMKAPDTVWKDAITKWSEMNWSKTKKSDFYGTLLIETLDKSGNTKLAIPGSRDAVDGATSKLLDVARSKRLNRPRIGSRLAD